MTDLPGRNNVATWSRLWAGIRGPTRRADPYAWREISYWRWLAIVAISLLAGIASGHRWFGYGRDYYDYLIAYANVETAFSLSYARFEPGYNLLAWVFRNILQVEYETFASALITISLIIKLYLIHRYLRYAVAATIIYFLFLYPVHEYTQVRVALGIGFGFWAMHLVLARRWFAAALAITVAILFHYTMIIFAFGLVGTFLVRSRRAVIIIGVVFTLSTLLLSGAPVNFVTSFAGWFNPLADVYIEQTARGLLNEAVNVFSVFSIALYLALITALMFKWFNEDRYRQVNVLLAMLSVVAMLLFISLPIFGHRVREVFAFAFILYAFRDARNEIEFAPALFVSLAAAANFAGALYDGIIVI